MAKKERKGWTPRLLFIFILVAPVIGFVYTKYMSDKKLKMPRHYVVDKVLQIPGKGGKVSADTIFRRMHPFGFQNQLGDTIGLENIDGLVVLVNFFETKDTVVSGPASRALAKISRSFNKSEKDFRVLSFSVDPAADSVPALLDYSFRFEANHGVWWFLRGNIDSVKEIAAHDFDIPLKENSNGQLQPSSMLVLLDRFQHVRGYYDALKQADLEKCVHDLSLLMIEKEKLDGVER